jgi:hypothetical protein
MSLIFTGSIAGMQISRENEIFCMPVIVIMIVWQGSMTLFWKGVLYDYRDSKTQG